MLLNIRRSKMNMGERIKELRLSKGLTQEELGKIIGVQKAAIQKYESGLVKNLKRSTIQILANLFEVPPSYIMGLEDKEINHIHEFPNIYPITSKKSVPLLGTIAAGIPTLAEEQAEYLVANEFDIEAHFALKIKGDSMINARINDGDIVFIRQQPDIEDGEIAAVLIDGEATLKRVYKMPGRVQLRAENPKYAPMDFTEKNCDDFKILGKAVGFQSKL